MRGLLNQAAAAEAPPRFVRPRPISWLDGFSKFPERHELPIEFLRALPLPQIVSTFLRNVYLCGFWIFRPTFTYYLFDLKAQLVCLRFVMPAILNFKLWLYLADWPTADQQSALKSFSKANYYLFHFYLYFGLFVPAFIIWFVALYICCLLIARRNKIEGGTRHRYYMVPDFLIDFVYHFFLFFLLATHTEVFIPIDTHYKAETIRYVYVDRHHPTGSKEF